MLYVTSARLLLLGAGWCVRNIITPAIQSVLYAAARTVFSARSSDHITPLLRELHWLKITERIQFRLCVLAYRCLHGSAPQYLAETLHLPSDTEACRRLRSGSTSTLFVPATIDDPASAIGHFLWPQRDYGTLSRSPCEQFHLT